MLEYEDKIEVHVYYVDDADSDDDRMERWYCEDTEVTANALLLHRGRGENGFPHTLIGIPLRNIKNWVERLPNT